MTSALGVNQAWLFTSVFALGAFLAALGGALQLPREAVTHDMDLRIIADAFVVVVVGGMGSVAGAFLAALLIGELTAFGIWVFPQITLVLTFLIMAVVLVVRPWGLLGRPELAAKSAHAPEPVLRPAGQGARLAAGAVVLALLAAAGGGRHLRAVPADRDFLPGPVRHQPALHHGPGRHGLVRPCRLFRARRLWRRARGHASGGADERGAGDGARGGAGGRPAVRLVLRAPFGRLPRDALAGVRPDRLCDRVPVVRLHRRRQRPGGHLAGALGELHDRLLLPGAGAEPLRAAAAAPLRVRAVRHDPARLPRCAAARRCDRHRHPHPPVAGLHDRGHLRRALGRHPGVPQGHDRSDLARDPAVDRGPGDGAAGRRPDARRARSSALPPITASRSSSRRSPATGPWSWARSSSSWCWPSRRASWALPRPGLPAGRGQADGGARGRGPAQGLSAACRRWTTSALRSRRASFWR